MDVVASPSPSIRKQLQHQRTDESGSACALIRRVSINTVLKQSVIGDIFVYIQFSISGKKSIRKISWPLGL